MKNKKSKINKKKISREDRLDLKAFDDRLKEDTISFKQLTEELKQRGLL